MNKKEFIMTIPNILTISRILLVPIFVISLLKEKFFYGLIIFAIAGISDGLDGMLAKYFKQKTVFGSYLDPIADKILIISSFVSLAILKIIPAWLTVIVLTRDLLIMLGVAIFAMTEIQLKIKPTIISKITTCVQITLVIIALFDLQTANHIIFVNLFVWLTAILTVVSGLYYIIIGLQILQGAPDSLK